MSAQNQPVILKLRYQLSNLKQTPSLRQSLARVSKENFNDEHNALSACQDIDTVPRLFTVGELVQGMSAPFPNGYLRAIVMSRGRGESVIEIFEELNEWDYGAIRGQLVGALENMRQKGYIVIDPPAEHIFFEKSTSKICLIGFSRAAEDHCPPEQAQPITEDSIDVLVF